MVAAYLRPALPRRRVLYLMSPMTLYGSPALEAAREYPFADLTGYPVQVWCAEDLYRSTKEWAAFWPLVRRTADCAVFLDHLGGWVARGVRVEAEGLLALGKPVWWFNEGEPTDRFGFSAPNFADFRYRHCRVGIGYGRPVRRTRDCPLEAPGRARQPLEGLPDSDSPSMACARSSLLRRFRWNTSSWVRVWMY